MSLSINPKDKNEILSGGLDDQINIINTEKGKNLFQMQFKETISDVSYNFDGSLFACLCLNNKIYCYDRKTLKQKFVFDEFDSEINEIQYHPKGNVILASSQDQSICLINSNNGKSMQ